MLVCRVDAQRSALFICLCASLQCARREAQCARERHLGMTLLRRVDAYVKRVRLLRYADYARAYYAAMPR